MKTLIRKGKKNISGRCNAMAIGTMCFLIIILASFVLADIATTGASIGNSAPVASSAQIAAGNLNGGDVALTSNTSVQLNITAVVTDNNGCDDITEVNATFYRTNLSAGSSAGDDNQSHYSIVCAVQAGTCTGGGDLAATYDCQTDIVWYTDPTDAGSFFAATNWSINVTPYDGGGKGTIATNIYDVKTLTSFALLTPSINFGTLGLGENTSTTNQNISLENLGNEAIDISLTGYGAASGDNLSMNCTVGNIAIDKLEYGNSAFTYGAGTSLTNTSTELDFDLDRGSEGTLRPAKTSFYGFSIPIDGVGGSCNGNLAIVATSDPNLD